MFDFEGKKIVIMGLGLHGGGVSSACFFAENQAKVIVTDLKTAKELRESVAVLKKYNNIAFVLGRHRKQDFKNADLIIRNPGVPNDSVLLSTARKAGVRVETDVSFLFNNADFFSIGITGTKGKTTTTKLLAKILPDALVAGNLGISAFEILPKLKSNKKKKVILELSSWQLESLGEYGISPNISVITNVFPDHLNRYKGFAEYKKAKQLIYKFQKTEDVCILNSAIGSFKPKSRVFWFGQGHNKNGVYKEGDWIMYRQGNRKQRIMRAGDIMLKGGHNVLNVMAVVCIAKVLGVPNKKIVQTVKSFKGLEHRLKYVKTIKGVPFYNDTSATMPTATMKALLAFPRYKGRIILIAGGSDKKLSYLELAKAVKKYCKCVVIYKGLESDKASDKMTQEFNVPFTVRKSLKACVLYAHKKAEKGDIVLFSPAASSFGKFKNEFDRGDQFIKIVKQFIAHR